MQTVWQFDCVSENHGSVEDLGKNVMTTIFIFPVGQITAEAWHQSGFGHDYTHYNEVGYRLEHYSLQFDLNLPHERGTT